MDSDTFGMLPCLNVETSAATLIDMLQDSHNNMIGSGCATDAQQPTDTQQSTETPTDENKQPMGKYTGNIHWQPFLSRQYIQHKSLPLAIDKGNKDSAMQLANSSAKATGKLNSSHN